MSKTGSALSRETIRELVAGQPPLLEGYINLEVQLQPNGVDLTLQSISAFGSRGHLGVVSSDRILPAITEVPFDSEGFATLEHGSYLLTLNEVVNLPLDLMALGRPRSTLNRCGVSIHSAVWDAGYSGRSQCLLVVYNPFGFQVEHNARVLQLVFVPLSQPVTKGYSGRYQGENR